MASSVEALAEAFEGTLRELRLRRYLKGASKASSTGLQIQFLKLPLQVPSRRVSHRLPDNLSWIDSTKWNCESSCRRSLVPSNPWVSVQDVVLNSLEPSTLPSQPLPELSHFYTHTSNRKMSAHVAMVLVVVSRLDTKIMRSRQLTSFCQLHKSDHKNTCLHKKSLHQDMVCLFK